MKISDTIEMFIREMLNNDESIELKRNELASHFNCVPSQINYVISTRFTNERGYIVESRRGGGGYIKITRVGRGGTQNAIMHILNCIGDNLDVMTMEAIVKNLYGEEIITAREAKMILASCGSSALREINDGEFKNRIRSTIFKNILINLM
jgi:transcriptional regulator CtsR